MATLARGSVLLNQPNSEDPKNSHWIIEAASFVDATSYLDPFLTSPWYGTNSSIGATIDTPMKPSDSNCQHHDSHS